MIRAHIWRGLFLALYQTYEGHSHDFARIPSSSKRSSTSGTNTREFKRCTPTTREPARRFWDGPPTGGTHVAWREFVARYEPYVRSWCREYRLDDDLAEGRLSAVLDRAGRQDAGRFATTRAAGSGAGFEGASTGASWMPSANGVGRNSLSERSMALFSPPSDSTRKMTDRTLGGCSCWIWRSRFKRPSARRSMPDRGKCSGISPSMAGARARRPML